jgi:hypothetical protein
MAAATTTTGHLPYRAKRESIFLPFYPYPLLLVAVAGCSTQTLATSPPCGHHHFFSAMPSDLKTEALWQRLDALVKDADVAEAKAIAARRHVQVARRLLEEEQATAADLERTTVIAKGLLPSSSSS